MKTRASPFACAAVVGIAGLALIGAAGAQTDSAKPADAAKTKSKSAGDPFPLATCPISGLKLDAKGEPVVKVYEGREVRFCCGGCPPRFEKDLAKSMAKLDEAIIADQLPLYPLTTSVVTGSALPDKPVDWVFENRLVRLGNESEAATFKADPSKYMATLNKAVIQKQSKDYPLKTCPASKEELGGMGEADDFVIAGRMIRLCCAACEKDVQKNPAKFIAIVDEAWKGKANRPSDGARDRKSDAKKSSDSKSSSDS